MKVSASRLSLLAECQHWPTLRGEPDTASEASDTGKAIHSMIECAMVGGEPEIGALADVAKCGKLLATWREWWPTHSTGESWRFEVPIVYDWQTGVAREMPKDWVKGGRHRADTELPVIIDAIGPGKIRDWKSGRPEATASSVQLRLAALAAMKLYGWATVEVGLVFLRVRSIPDPVLVSLDAMDLLDFEAQLRSWMRAIPTAEPRKGDWCFRCKGKSECAAMVPQAVDFDSVFEDRGAA